jgi:hypothetical protein
MTNGIKKPADRKNCQTGYAEIWQMRRHTECWQIIPGRWGILKTAR